MDGDGETVGAGGAAITVAASMAAATAADSLGVHTVAEDSPDVVMSAVVMLAGVQE
jgi:hypothetical protein